MNLNHHKTILDANKHTVLLGIAEGPKFDRLTLLSLTKDIPIITVFMYALRPDVGGPNPDIEKDLQINLDWHKYSEIIPWSDL